MPSAPPPGMTPARCSSIAAAACLAGRAGRALITLAAVLAMAVVLPPARAQAQPPWQALAQLAHGGVRVSAAAVDLADDRLVSELNGGQRLQPASLTKLATAAVALNQWPADRILRTRLMAQTAPVDGVLSGDLILQGAGDPSLDDQGLWSLAAQLRGTGITAVRGRLRVDAAPFGPVPCETLDRCNAGTRSDRSYNAPVGAVGVDYGNWCISVRPTSAGIAALLRGCGVMQLPLPIQGSIRTVGRGGRQDFWVERVTTAAGDALRVGGNIPAGDTQQVYRAMSDPPRAAGLLLKEMLLELGVTVAGPVVVEAGQAPPDAYTLGEAESLSLREQLGRMLRFSNNYIADVLTLDLAADIDGRPPLRLAAAAHVLSDFVARLPLPRPASGDAAQSCGAAAGPPLLYSGSGLTPENRLSACDLVAVLAHQYRDTRRFPAFYGGMVVPRDAPFAFLREGSAAWLDRVALKTGSMDEPHSVLGIAGYLRKRDGGWMAFAAIVNGGGAQPHVPLDRALAAARADVETLLAEY